MKHALAKKGLSMSQAQTISNLANQAATDLQGRFSMYNNAKKIVDFKGKSLVQEDPRPIPTDINKQLQKVGEYRALQAFLMEQVKAKDGILKELREQPFITKLDAPEQPALEKYVATKPVGESWGWDQLSIAELTEYWTAEAKAAVIGKFIHAGGKLDQLRKELPNIERLQWFVEPGYQGQAHPIEVTIHSEHTDEKLFKLHQDLANEHRELEQKVNYFKAKVKNIVALENSRIAKENAQKVSELNEKNTKLMNEYRIKLEEHNGKVTKEIQEFESERELKIKDAAALRIQIPASLQERVDELMPKDTNVDDEDIARESDSEKDK